MMLVHVPADGRKATAISFPRDSYVQIPGFGRHKLTKFTVVTDEITTSHPMPQKTEPMPLALSA